MVQADHFKMTSDDNKNKTTTLTIVQDFPKKKVDKDHHGVEMVQQAAPSNTEGEKEDGKIVLKIVQDFSKKQPKETHKDKKPTFGDFLTAKVTRVKNFFSKLFGAS